jgi:hypothetical protein
MKCTFPYLLIFAAGVVLGSQALAELNLSRAELELKNNPKGLPGAESLQALERQEPGIQANIRLLTQLAVQSNYPLVSFAAITGLRNADSNQAYIVSLARCWNSTNIGSLLMIPFLLHLTNHVDYEIFRAAFAVVSLSEPGNMQSAMFTIQQIEQKQLVRWLLSEARLKAPATVEALVVERLLSQKDALDKQEVKEVLARWAELEHFPGLPTAIFLLHSEKIERAVTNRIQILAEDSTLDLTIKRMLFKKFATELRGSLNIDQLAVSDKEKEHYRRWLLTDEKPK